MVIACCACGGVAETAMLAVFLTFVWEWCHHFKNSFKRPLSQ